MPSVCMLQLWLLWPEEGVPAVARVGKRGTFGSKGYVRALGAGFAPAYIDAPGNNPLEAYLPAVARTSQRCSTETHGQGNDTGMRIQPQPYAIAHS